MEGASGGVTTPARPGMTIMTADGAFELLQHYLKAAGPPTSVYLGGLGEPLLDRGTYSLLRRMHAVYPELPLTVWTNGLLLTDRLDELIRAGLRGIVLSIHAATREGARAFYDWAVYRGRRLTGQEASDRILRLQWSGLANAIEAGIATTVYTVRGRGVKDHEADQVAAKARSIGVDRVQIIEIDAR